MHHGLNRGDAGRAPKLYELERRWEQAKEKRDKLKEFVDGAERRYYGLHRVTSEDLARARAKLARAEAAVDRAHISLTDRRAVVIGELVRLYPPAEQLAQWSEMTTWPSVYLDEQRAVFAEQLAAAETVESQATDVRPRPPLGSGRDGGSDQATAQRLMAAELERRRSASPPEPLPNSVTEMARVISWSEATLRRWRRDGVPIFDAEWLAHLQRIRPRAGRTHSSVQ